MKKLVVLFILILMLGACLLCTSLCYADEIQEDSQEIVVEETIEATPDNDAWEWVKDAWARCKHILIGAFSGVSASTIVGAVFIVIIKRSTNKVADKIENNTNSNAIAEKTANKMVEKWGNVVLDVNLKTLMERQYLELSNRVYADLDKAIKTQDEKYLAMVSCFEMLSHYYDGSVGVTDEQRKELADAIAYAKSLGIPTTKVVATIEAKAEESTNENTTILPENY